MLFANVSGLLCEADCGMYGTDVAHPSEGRTWARSVTEGPALSVLKRKWIVNVVGVKCWHVLKLVADALFANVPGLFWEAG